jgi:hypothetical protein
MDDQLKKRTIDAVRSSPHPSIFLVVSQSAVPFGLALKVPSSRIAELFLALPVSAEYNSAIPEKRKGNYSPLSA